MKHRTMTITVFCLFLLLLSGCNLLFPTQPYYLLTENTCDFPCWMGITPGKTQYSDIEYHMELIVESFSRKDIEVTFEEKIHPGGFIYFQVFMPGIETWVKLDSTSVVNEITIHLLNNPTVEDFALNFRTPDYIGVCLAFRRAVPVMIYEGMRVYPKAEIPDYDSEANTITIEDFYRERVDLVVLEIEPQINH